MRKWVGCGPAKPWIARVGNPRKRSYSAAMGKRTAAYITVERTVIFVRTDDDTCSSLFSVPPYSHGVNKGMRLTSLSTRRSLYRRCGSSKIRPEVERTQTRWNRAHRALPWPSVRHIPSCVSSSGSLFPHSAGPIMWWEASPRWKPEGVLVRIL